MVLYLLERRMKPTFRSLYASLFADLEKFAVPEDKLAEPLNLMMLKCICLKEVEYVRLCHRYIEQMWTACQKGPAAPDIDLNYLIFRIKRCKVLVTRVLFRCPRSTPSLRDSRTRVWPPRTISFSRISIKATDGPNLENE